jgi:hypothetical protein
LLEAGGAIESSGFLERGESLEDGGQGEVAGDEKKNQERDGDRDHSRVVQSGVT